MIKRGPKIVTKNLQHYFDVANSYSYPRTGTDFKSLVDENVTCSIQNDTAYDTRVLGVLQFDGVDDHIIFPPITASKSQYSIMSWVLIDDFDTGKSDKGRVFLRNSNSNLNNLISFYDGGYSFETNTNSDPHEIAAQTSGSVSSDIIVTGSWFNFALVFDNNNFYGYINGTLNGSGSISDNMYINRFGDASGYSTLYPSYFKGMMSNIMFYNKSLSEKEVNDNFDAQKSRFYSYVPDQINYFISTWKTDNSGVSNSDQIRLPLTAGGTYDMIVDWGDGSSDTITVYNQSEVTHTYSVAGTYTVKISGTCIGWQFNNGGDKSKILSVEKWGILEIKDTAAFYGCVNLDSIAIDSPIISTTSLYRCFRNCTSLTGGISNWNVSNVTNFTETFLSANSFTGDITQWNVSSGTTFTRMFGSNSGFNQDISGWDVSSATRMDYMFQNATSFDQNLATWNITSIDSALAGATFGSMVGMFSGVTLSTSNYDAILIGWESQGVNGVKFDGGNSKYTAGGPAEAARSSLINTYGWTISDGGSV